MSNGVTLRQLIDQVRTELTRDPDRNDTPLFFVEKVEIQVSVNIVQEGSGGINLQVINVGGGVSKESSNTITVSLTPILSQEEMRQLLDTRDMLDIRRVSGRDLTGASLGRIGD